MAAHTRTFGSTVAAVLWVAAFTLHLNTVTDAGACASLLLGLPADRIFLDLRVVPQEADRRMDLTPTPAPAALAELSLAHTRGCAKSWEEVTGLLRCDLQRYCDEISLKTFARHYVFSPGFRYTLWMRVCGYLKVTPWTRLTIYPFAKLHLLHLRYKFGFVIPEYTAIGPGLFLNRFGGVYVNGDSIIGCNVNITPGTVLGQSNRGAKMGSPIIGDRVFLGQGSKVVGRVFVGDDAVVGTGSVVTKDVPANGVALGMPAKVQSLDGSQGYVNRLADLSRVERFVRRPQALDRSGEAVGDA